jgi:hypothetical protein
MASPNFDVSQAHRWFAIDCNNQAWDILDGTDRSQDAISRLLNLAHAACCHWFAIGMPINRQRALDLLSWSYVAAGQGDLALRFARQAFELSEQLRDEQTQFDRTQTLGTMAMALSAAGLHGESAQWMQKALDASTKLETGEQQTLRRLWEHGGKTP